MQTSLALFQRIFEYLDLPRGHHRTRPPRSALERVTRRGPLRERRLRLRQRASRRDSRRHRHRPSPRAAAWPSSAPTGAGKTTLSYLVPRLYDVTGGRVTIDGVDVRDLDFDTLARAVGVVSQETYLFHASVADNLRFAKPDATDGELRAAAEAAQIHDHIASLPDGYDTLVGERGYRFSGGEKQRLAHRPYDPARPAGAHPRRGDQRAGHPYRTRRAAGHRRPVRGPHHPHHRPPALHRPRRRPDRGARRADVSPSAAPTRNCSPRTGGTRRWYAGTSVPRSRPPRTGRSLFRRPRRAPLTALSPPPPPWTTPGPTRLCSERPGPNSRTRVRT